MAFSWLINGGDPNYLLTGMIRVASTPWKINILNPKSWRFGSDDFPFFIGWFLGSKWQLSRVYHASPEQNMLKGKPTRKEIQRFSVKDNLNQKTIKKGPLSEKLQSWFR